VKFALWLLAGSLAAAPVSFQKDVRPILQARCATCHPSGHGASGISTETYRDLIEGNLIVPGKPEESILLRVVSPPRVRMPKTGAPLSAREVEIIRQWIAGGASGDSVAQPSTWWSLRPLTPGPHNSIDAYLTNRLRQEGLSYSPPASRATLIRRLTFNLHGLPPTPAEIEAFVNDKSPDAYSKLIDRLLASPRYGERWARHWLDIVHYADSHGYDKDKPRPNAWPYRDAVIRAFNEDLPYSDFVRYQLAGDVLAPNNPRAFELTGFLAAGPWDFVGHQELKEGATDKNLTRSLDRDDMVATTISTFVSLTAHCARCHDHKFDPIPQEDYYRLQAVFAGIDRADRPYDDDPQVFAQRRALLAERQQLRRQLQPWLDRIEFATSPEIVALDIRISDATLLLAHLGAPKNAAEQAEKQRLEQRLNTDRQARLRLVEALVGPEPYAQAARLKADLAALDARLAALPAPRHVYSGSSDFDRTGNFRPALDPRPIHLLQRGNVSSPGPLVTAGALRLLPGLPHEIGDLPEGQRRAALARWITHPDNVLTWRSIVNRVWQYHFGVGLVDSPSDFGRMGSRPSHPELLDWLALWFRDQAKGSLKQLHRLILLSAAYQQSSAHRPDAAQIDADNRLLWRMNRIRLDAESIRDATLAAAGKIDFTMGGPGVRLFHFKDDHSPVYDYAAFDPDQPAAYRRSIYRFIVRSVPDPFLERLDCPDPSLQTPKRNTTLTAIQALALWNNPFMVRMAAHIGQRTAGDPNALALLLWGRPATAAESALFQQYAARHGAANLARLLLNSNEFLFVD
jgi:hypothetical protein